MRCTICGFIVDLAYAAEKPTIDFTTAGRAKERKGMSEPRYTEAEWRDLNDLRKHWGSFCDADPFEGADTFTERMEARGYIHLRPVRRADLKESFAAERGIEPGGNLWELTAKGRAAIEPRADGE